MDVSSIAIIYAMPIGLIWVLYVLWGWHREAKSRAIRAAAVEAGLV